MESSNDNRLVLRESNSDSQSRETMEQPRQPRNMQDLLRYAIEAESNNPTGSPPREDVRPLDPEGRQFLENVLSSITIDVVKLLKSTLATLQLEYKPGQSTEKFEDAFEEILDIVDNMDIANDYYKLGGFDVCKNWLEKGPPGLRWRAANVIAECCQNNPFCQVMAIESGFLQIFMDLTQNDPDEMVKVKSFHAVSCIVRNNDNALLNFLSLNGHKFILYCLKSQSHRLKTKAAFFTSVIANKEAMLKDQLWDIGVAKELASLICTSQKTRLIDDVACFEQCLSALLCLVKDSKKKLDDVNTTVESLTHLSTILLNRPSYLESVDYIKLILETINPKMTP